jgi:hypothetical protein
MKDSGSLHLKVQELCDCYATNDPLKEMSSIQGDTDKSEAALKWLALAALHGVTANAKKITLLKDKAGNINVVAKYRKSDLPSPGSEIGSNVFSAIREITHIEGEGKIPLALGIRDSSIEADVKIKSDEDGEKLTIKFGK